MLAAEGGRRAGESVAVEDFLQQFALLSAARNEILDCNVLESRSNRAGGGRLRLAAATALVFVLFAAAIRSQSSVLPPSAHSVTSASVYIPNIIVFQSCKSEFACWSL